LLAWAALCVALLALLFSIIALARGRSYGPREWIEASERALEEKLRRLGPVADRTFLLQPPPAQDAQGPEVTSEELLDRVKRTCAAGLTDFQRRQPIDELKGRKARLECIVDDVSPWPEILGPATAQLKAHLVGSPLTLLHDPETGKATRERQLLIRVDAYIPKDKAAALRRSQRACILGKIDAVLYGYPVTAGGDWQITLKPAEPVEPSTGRRPLQP